MGGYSLRRGEQGLTLLEVLLAMAIGGLLLGAIVGIAFGMVLELGRRRS